MPAISTATLELWHWRTVRLQSPAYLAERLELGLHDEVVLAELTAARVRALDPLVQAGLVHEAQCPRAAARRDEGALIVSLTVTDPDRRDSKTVRPTSNAEALPYLHCFLVFRLDIQKKPGIWPFRRRLGNILLAPFCHLAISLHLVISLGVCYVVWRWINTNNSFSLFCMAKPLRQMPEQKSSWFVSNVNKTLKGRGTYPSWKYPACEVQKVPRISLWSYTVKRIRE